MKYQNFIKQKNIQFYSNGFNVPLTKLNKQLFDWQKIITRWNLFKGRSALFASYGMGKTPMQLEFAQKIVENENKNVIILAPLAVSFQTKREGEKFGIKVNICKDQSDVKKGINITNYERIDKFDTKAFTGVVLDESSILKSFMGKTKIKLFKKFIDTKYKLVCSATPSPNDHMELLNQADFLGIMPSNEALSRWFINDTMNMGKYRLKKYAVGDFWNWVSSWAVYIDRPSDVGNFDDADFILPKLVTKVHVVGKALTERKNGMLLDMPVTLNASNLYKELRYSAEERCEFTSKKINKSNEKWVVWCNTNKEAGLLSKQISDSVNVHGSLSLDKKEDYVNQFSSGLIKVMVTKPSMCGHGLNWQHVRNNAFVGLSYSFEQLDQAVHRTHRFGQKRIVYQHIVMSPSEKKVYEVVKKKARQQKEMREEVFKTVRNYSNFNIKRKELSMNKTIKLHKGNNWSLYEGDAVEAMRKIKTNTIDFGIHSPPFSFLYIYSDSAFDLGNSKDDNEFFDHYEYIISELYRTTRPGRLCAVHCKDLVDYKGRDGKAGLRDFPGEIVRRFEKHGWKYHSRVTIWKDPVIEMQRTKAHGLLHKQMKKDSSFSRNGLPDYLLMFRKWSKESDESYVSPVEHPEGFEHYMGIDKPALRSNSKWDKEGFSIHVWQRYASPVWFDIRQTNCLNVKQARSEKDEKHICPLQLDVIERCIHLWSNPGDIVFSPFAGIGSELYTAIKLGRKAIGIELKKEYVNTAIKYLNSIASKKMKKLIR